MRNACSVKKAWKAREKCMKWQKNEMKKYENKIYGKSSRKLWNVRGERNAWNAWNAWNVWNAAGDDGLAVYDVFKLPDLGRDPRTRHDDDVSAARDVRSVETLTPPVGQMTRHLATTRHSEYTSSLHINQNEK